MSEKAVTRIIERVRTGGSYYLLTLGHPFRTPILPGQFVMLSAAGTLDPFLKRPYSVYRARPKSAAFPDGEIALLIKAVGRGTRQMADLPLGAPVEIVGPLGRPFTVPPGIRQALFVAGGIGVAPFVELAACGALQGVPMLALIGGRRARDLQAVEELKNLGAAVRLATEDGSLGRRGRVTELLAEAIASGLPQDTVIYSCGPEAMMKAVGALAIRHGLPCQLSLEARMGCGFGVCLGCVVKNRAGQYVRVCREGPVMEARDLLEYGAEEERA